MKIEEGEIRITFRAKKMKSMLKSVKKEADVKNY